MPLDAVDRDGAVELDPVAGRLARVVADAAVDGRQRVVGRQLSPRLLLAPGLDEGEPGLDVLARGAADVARRQQVDVDGTLLADRPDRVRPRPSGAGGVRSRSASGHGRLLYPSGLRVRCVLPIVVTPGRRPEWRSAKPAAATPAAVAETARTGRPPCI